MFLMFTNIPTYHVYDKGDVSEIFWAICVALNWLIVPEHEGVIDLTR